MKKFNFSVFIFVLFAIGEESVDEEAAKTKKNKNSYDKQFIELNYFEKMSSFKV